VPAPCNSVTSPPRASRAIDGIVYLRRRIAPITLAVCVVGFVTSPPASA
jgi:hypothetical protein